MTTVALVDGALSGDARELLVRLLRGTPRTFEQIREIAPGGIDLTGSLTRLEAAGLVRVAADGLEVIPPAEAIAEAVRDALAGHARRVGALAEALREAGTAAEGAPLPCDPAGCPAILVAGDASAWLDRAEAGAGGRLAVGDPAPVWSRLVDAARSGFDGHPPAALLLPTSALALPGAREVLSAIVRAGCAVRVRRRVPAWVAHAEGGVTLSADPADTPVSGIVCSRMPAVVDAVRAVLDGWWASAVEVPLPQTVPEAALSLWAQGHDDAEVACALRVSQRTVQRVTADLMARAGARSRFELGVWWARAHGLPDTTTSPERTSRCPDPR